MAKAATVTAKNSPSDITDRCHTLKKVSEKLAEEKKAKKAAEALVASSQNGAAASKARLDSPMAINEKLKPQQAAPGTLLVEVTLLAEQTKSAHASALTAQGFASAAAAAKVARGEDKDRKKVANELAETNYLVLQVAHEATVAANKRAHDLEIASHTQAHSSLVDARAADAGRSPAPTE